MAPIVSVLIDTYNHERFIEQAIVSVLEQDFPEKEREILVVDDGSTDRTPEIIRKFAPYVRYLRKENGGQASAFNVGIPECKSEIIAFLDGDDWWAKGKLRAVVDTFGADPSIGTVGHGITEVFSDGREHAELLRETPRFRLNSEEGVRAFRLRKSFLGTSRLACRREVLRQIGAVPENIRIEADEYLFTVAAVLGDVLILRESLTYYRLHGGNAFQLGDGNVDGLRRKQLVLEALAAGLQKRLNELSVATKVTQMVVDWVELEAKLLKLSLDGGYPWMTVHAELNNFHIRNENATAKQKLFKYLSLLPACVLPARTYYSLRQRVARSVTYRKAREKWLPFIRPSHVDRYHTAKH